MAITESEALAIAEEAARRALAARPVPSCVSLTDAAEILCVSRPRATGCARSKAIYWMHWCVNWPGTTSMRFGGFAAMTNLTTWVNETPERRRSYEQERLIVDVAEAVQGLLDKAGMKRAELGRRTGIARQSLHQMLSGQQNLTLRTMATIAHELGYRVSVSFEPYCSPHQCGEST